MRISGPVFALAFLISSQAAAQPELESYRDCASQWAESHIERPDDAEALAQAALDACSEQRKTMLASYEAAGFTEELSASYLESAESSIRNLLVAQIARWRG
ncbi:MAG: hypothetical protein AAF414_19400 [Pseudomonadota bacterium]